VTSPATAPTSSADVTPDSATGSTGSDMVVTTSPEQVDHPETTDTAPGDDTSNPDTPPPAPGGLKRSGTFTALPVAVETEGTEITGDTSSDQLENDDVSTTSTNGNGQKKPRPLSAAAATSKQSASKLPVTTATGR